MNILDYKEDLMKLKESFQQSTGANLMPLLADKTEEEYIPDYEQLKEEEIYKDIESRSVKVSIVEKIEGDFKKKIPHNVNLNGLCFKYFIDGSVRSLRILDGIEGNNRFPIVISQVGAVSLERENKNLKLNVFNSSIYLLIPLCILSDTLRSNIEKRFERASIKIEDPLYRRDIGTCESELKQDYIQIRNRASRRAKDLMADIEKIVLLETIKNINKSNEYILLDGSLFTPLKEARIHRDDLSNVVGVSKSFSLKPLLLLQEYLNRDDLIEKVFSLEEGERTNAFELHIENTWVVTWFQRIRPRNKVNSPLEGIVKVEVVPKNYDKKDELFSTGIYWDAIAKLVYDERFPIPYHEDRWYSLLYPIYMCERYLKSSFLSFEVLKGLIINT